MGFSPHPLTKVNSSFLKSGEEHLKFLVLPLEIKQHSGAAEEKKNPTPQAKYFVWDSFLTDQGKVLVAISYYEATISLITWVGCLGCVRTV